MATGYKHSGKHITINTASADIASGALVFQEGVVGVAITSAKSGKTLEIDTKGVWNITVPSGTTRGDKLYNDLSGESVALTLSREAGDYLVGIALSDRDALNKADVLLAAPFTVALGAS